MAAALNQTAGNQVENHHQLNELSYSNGVGFLSNYVPDENEEDEEDEEDEEEEVESQQADSNHGSSSNGANHESCSSYIQPYDIGGLSTLPDESTEEIARKVKDYLLINKISQKKFAESVLNMRQANFSSLMSQPLSWSTLTKTYRERFLLIHMWLNDPHRMRKLDAASTSNINNKSGNYSQNYIYTTFTRKISIT